MHSGATSKAVASGWLVPELLVKDFECIFEQSDLSSDDPPVHVMGCSTPVCSTDIEIYEFIPVRGRNLNGLVGLVLRHGGKVRG